MLGWEDLRFPSGWKVMAGADTGTYMSGSITAISPECHAFTVYELANYRYVGGEIELLDLTVSQWFKQFSEVYHHLARVPKSKGLGMWADANTTFKTEVGHKLTFLPNRIKLEHRSAIAREYLQQGAAWLAPWLTLLPREIENARFPDHESASGTFARLKVDDHTLDTWEHVLSRRPRPKSSVQKSKPSLLEKLRAANARPQIGPKRDVHMGRL